MFCASTYYLPNIHFSGFRKGMWYVGGRQACQTYLFTYLPTNCTLGKKHHFYHGMLLGIARNIKGTVKAIIEFCLAVSVLLIFLICAVPIFILCLPLILYGNRKHKLAYQDFLKENEGCCYFVYTDKRKTKDFIEGHILPALPSEIKVVSIRDKKFLSPDNGIYVLQLVESTVVWGGYPILIKITSGKPCALSVNNKTYESIQKESPEILLNNIFAFVS